MHEVKPASARQFPSSSRRIASYSGSRPPHRIADQMDQPPEPYERLLHAGLAGDHQLFARQDSVEETWRIVQPLLDHPPDVRPYPRGSWGPDDAQALVRGHPRWQPPWLPTDG